jgi:predicted nucleic acid-binding protein
VIYLDSSALLKHYVREAGSDALDELVGQAMNQGRSVFMSVLGYPEILATFARRIRENLRLRAQLVSLQDRFKNDWARELSQVELNARVRLFIPRLLNSYPLKGSDAVHLASALWLRDALRLGLDFGRTIKRLTFATSDRQLKRAAAAEGLEVFDPEDMPRHERNPSVSE